MRWVLLFILFIILDFGTNFFDYWVNLYGENIGNTVPALIIIFIWILIPKLFYHIKKHIEKNKIYYQLVIDKLVCYIKMYVNAKDYKKNVRIEKERSNISYYNSVVARITNMCVENINNIQRIENMMRTDIYCDHYNFEFLYNKGVCCFYLEKFSEAIKYFDEALSIRKDSRAFYNRALCRFKLKDIPNALKDFQLALQDEQILILPNVQKVKNFVDKIYGDI